MRTFVKLPWQFRATAIVAAALAPFVAGSPVLANEAGKTVMANAELTHAQESDSAADYDRRAYDTQNRADAVDRAATIYYAEQKRRTNERAEELNRDAESYYGKQK